MNEDSYKLCPGCGSFQEAASEVMYCGECGKRMIDRCPDCREPIYYPKARFCPSCGLEYVSGRDGGNSIEG